VGEILADRYQVIALDLPGLGDSSAPTDYRKTTIAAILAHAVSELVGESPIGLVGHDWGGIVGMFWAAADPTAVSRLAVVDVVTLLEFESLALLIPGGNPAWHFAFHGVAELPEMLIEGREESYLRGWYDHGSATVGQPDEDAVAKYVSAYARPGAMSAGFDYYRAVIDDLSDARSVWSDKLTLPVLAVGGEHSFAVAVSASMQRIANDVTAVVISGAGHWVPDEKPAELAAELIDFFG
jgi:pimeloyl-ACP methyl ester carboxylesterase